MCYKTTVAQCVDGYRVYLSRRNQQTLQSHCENETDLVPESSSGGRFLQSPHYSCEKPPYNKYHNSEFCLYDISIPDCPSGRVIVDNELHYTQELEQRQRYHICSDYVQLFTDSTASDRYCDTELSRIKLELPTTQFTALFWADISFNKLGFKLRVSCVN